MPSRIQVLPDVVVNKIAAGEVVERPASIVKELVENAIDAGTDRIDIEVTGGGRSSIRVVDNGCGMSRDDALLAIERHATSKLRQAADLEGLRTLGFRGEALPSISAVSRLTLETCLPGEPEGTRLRIQDGRLGHVEAIGRDAGTTVLVEDLFRNTPARREFLKTASTEWRHIVQAVTGLALAHSRVAFSLTRDGRPSLHLPRASSRHRMEALFSVDLETEACYFEAEEKGMGCTGYVTKPDLARKGGSQVLVVNRRWIRHRQLSTAVLDGYGGLLGKQAVPAFALCVDVDPAVLDVNVHPSKREVRFAEDRVVYRFVANSVRRAVRSETHIPNWTDKPIEPIDLGSTREDEATYQKPTETATASMAADRSSQPYGTEPIDLHNTQIGLPLTVEVEEAPDPDAEPPPAPRTATLGAAVYQLHRAYVLTQVKQGFVVIDQHLAHRRIIYETTVRTFRESPDPGQSLLFPITLELGLSEIVAVRDAITLFERVGFGIRDFGGNAVVIDTIPASLDSWEEGAAFRAMVDDLVASNASALSLEDRDVTPLEHIVAMAFARHAAIRHGRSLSTEEMRALIDDLFATEEPFHTPEGRPTLFRVSLDEIEQRFRP